MQTDDNYVGLRKFSSLKKEITEVGAMVFESEP
jgi:hypothetical protein